jgi:hypothetical protein
LLPGTAAIAAQVARAVTARRMGEDRSPRLCSEDGKVLHRPSRVPAGARLLRWHGLVFAHYAGTEWRRVPVIDVQGEGR